MRKTGAQIIVKLLERQGVTTVAGIPGGSNLPLYDAMRGSRIRHVLARHEQGAGFIAQGIARVTGRAGVCFATSGPGATNLLTAIADAKLDSIPLVAITGQVPTKMMGTDAFQEVDTYGLTLPITKHNFIVRDAQELLEVIPEAFAIAESGRPGPVVVDVPKDVQQAAVDFDAWPAPFIRNGRHDCDEAQIRRLAEMVDAAERPVLYIGGGVIGSNASATLITLARKNSIPVTSTLAGLGAFPSDDPLYLGMLGMHGARYTNLILDEADLLIAVGVRFDDRATGKISEFCQHASVAHIDIDPSEIDKIKETNLSIVADAGDALRHLLPRVRTRRRKAWTAHIEALREEWPQIFPATDDPLQPINFIRQLAEFTAPDTVITTDVGQHQMWIAQVYPFRQPRTLLTSGGLGTMGFGLPAAIGAALARPGERVVCVSGDGSILMNLQELATLAELNLDLTVIVMNNQQLGLVRQQQELFYGERYHAAHFESRTDYPALARSLGIRGYDLNESADPARVLDTALNTRGPNLINVPIHQGENVLPMVPPGGANHEMIGGEKIHV